MSGTLGTGDGGVSYEDVKGNVKRNEGLRGGGMERRTRSLIKAFSWRALASTTTGFIVYVLTGNYIISLSAAFIEFCVKPVLYYFHERLWSNIQWGYKR